ncbi:esterase-like activity of phytase family protein [Myxosarcina sp. GI1]|uniref:esterase-like activity of phytase family protein n=1 Tax=Myxosarcina sp. GI1 TaxID=1541065 RepID=UPI000AB88C7E|nr:esterase-like activity of phytase family protein [Myxosarcina sp. GI1]
MSDRQLQLSRKILSTSHQATVICLNKNYLSTIFFPKETFNKIERKLFFLLKSFATVLIGLVLCFSLTGCTPPKRLAASERIFTDLSLEFLDKYELPKTIYEDTPVGGLSAIAYDRNLGLFYAISDDRSQRAPARFYTLKLDLKSDNNTGIKINSLEVKNVTFLRDANGNTYAQGTIDAEGIGLSPRKTVFVSSEGDPKLNVAPFIAEFDLETGTKKLDATIPQRYLPDSSGTEPKGIQENLAFESLTLSQSGLLSDDPFRLFVATESALTQDKADSADVETRIRFLHYSIDSFSKPVLLAEHLYLLEPAPPEVIANGLTELVALDLEGKFLSLERTFGFTGVGAKIFQVVVGDATDITNVASLKGQLGQIKPLKKKLLFDLSELGIYLDNLEGMTLGPRLPDGSQSLLLVSDDNFNEEQITQFLLFRLVNGS